MKTKRQTKPANQPALGRVIQKQPDPALAWEGPSQLAQPLSPALPLPSSDPAAAYAGLLHTPQSSSATSRAEIAHTLQRTVGNACVARMLGASVENSLAGGAPMVASQQVIDAPGARRAQRQARAIQRSPLSDRLDQIWSGSPTKAGILGHLRSISPKSSASDADTKAWLAKTFAQSADDLWLAQAILEHGPEPFWPSDVLAERQRRAGANKWAPEAVEASLGVTKGKRQIQAFFFQGVSDQRALVIAGVHGTERQGMQVAELLIEDLKKAQPFFTVIVVPSLFPDNQADGAFGKREGDTQTNRNFPEGGMTLDEATKAGGGTPKDKNNKPILPENIMLMELMERFQPSRIISIHGTHDAKKAGVFSDPHFLSPSKLQEIRRAAWELAGEWEIFQPPARMPGQQDQRRFANAAMIEQQMIAEMEKLSKQRTLDDQQLAIAAAREVADKTKGLSGLKKRAGGKAVKENPAVAGNRLDRGAGKENPTWPGGTEEGVSLGSYAPGRGMSVFTVEPAINRNSGDYPSGKDPEVTKAEREMELKAYADAIETLLLGDPAQAKKKP
jgi:hypothetical protein